MNKPVAGIEASECGLGLFDQGIHLLGDNATVLGDILVGEDSGERFLNLFHIDRDVKTRPALVGDHAA